MSLVLAGAPVVQSMVEDLSARAQKLTDAGHPPTLALVRVGERPDALSYERSAIKRATSVGIEARHVIFEETCTTKDVIEAIQRLNADNTLDGCLMFRPLPGHLDEQRICDAIAPEKDLDGVSSTSAAGLLRGANTFSSCTAEAVFKLLAFYNISVAGKRVLIIGRSQTTGLPIALLALHQNATITIAHRTTNNLKTVCKEADIILSVAGSIGVVQSSWLNSNQVVVDVGINFHSTTKKLVGDVEWIDNSHPVFAYSPVPNGVGGLTTAMLAQHTIQAAERNVHGSEH